MKKRNYPKLIILSSILSGMFFNCSSFDKIMDTEKVEPLQAEIRIEIELEGFDSPEGLSIVLMNYLENIRVEKEFSGLSVVIDSLIPGIYTLTVSGKTYDNQGQLYYLNGGLVNYPLIKNNETVEISISGLKISPLVFKEIYYAGSAPNYFRDQFYEIYNNSDSILYLDGIYFAALYPTAATENLPVWPESDENKYVYTDRLWKFPGSGSEYPLKPGESCVVSQFAANHQLDIYNPNSPVDCSSSEFEFNMNNKNFPDQPAYDMVHVFYNGSSAMGTVPQ